MSVADFKGNKCMIEYSTSRRGIVYLEGFKSVNEMLSWLRTFIVEDKAMSNASMKALKYLQRRYSTV